MVTKGDEIWNLNRIMFFVLDLEDRAKLDLMSGARLARRARRKKTGGDLISCLFSGADIFLGDPFSFMVWKWKRKCN